MTTTFAFHGLRRMSVLSLLVAVNAVMLLSCRREFEGDISCRRMLLGHRALFGDLNYFHDRPLLSKSAVRG